MKLTCQQKATAIAISLGLVLASCDDRSPYPSGNPVPSGRLEMYCFRRKVYWAFQPNPGSGLLYSVNFTFTGEKSGAVASASEQFPGGTPRASGQTDALFEDKEMVSVEGAVLADAGVAQFSGIRARCQTSL